MGKKQSEPELSIECKFFMRKIVELTLRIQDLEARLDKNDKKEG